MANTTIDFGAANASRYYTLNGPALPNADWCIGGWIRRDRANASGYQTLVSINSGSFGNDRVSLFHGGSYFVAVAIAQDGAGHVSPTLFGEYAEDSLNHLIVLQRRGSNLEIYTVAKGATASAPNDSGAHAFTTGIAAATWNIGRREDDAAYNTQPFGEVFCLLNDSLTAAEVSTLAAGAHITAVRASPEIDLRFRTSNDPEPDLSGNGYDADQFGTGWTTATEFFPDGAATTVVTADSTLEWSILQLISSDIDARWSVLQNVNADADLRWSVLQNIHRDLELRWNSDGTVTTINADLSLQWSIISAIQHSLQLDWDIRQAVAAGATLQWSVIGLVERSLMLRWSIQSDLQFPDISGTITIDSATPRITIATASPIITIH